MCLTATSPPWCEATFLRVMDVGPSEVKIVRESTVRPNIAYSVVAYDGVEENVFVAATIQAKLAQYPAQDRIIVYCRTIAQMQSFAQTIRGTIFHNKVGDIAKQWDIVGKLTTGEERLFWSTSALGEVIDAATIRVVIHVCLGDRSRWTGPTSGKGVVRGSSFATYVEDRAESVSAFEPRTRTRICEWTEARGDGRDSGSGSSM